MSQGGDDFKKEASEQELGSTRVRTSLANQGHSTRAAPLPVPTSTGPVPSEGGSFLRTAVQSVIGGAANVANAVSGMLFGSPMHLPHIVLEDDLDSVSDGSGSEDEATAQRQQFSSGANDQMDLAASAAAQSMVQLLSQKPASASKENGDRTEEEAFRAAMAASMKDDAGRLPIILDADENDAQVGDESDFECTVFDEFDVSLFAVDRYRQPNRFFFMRGRTFEFAGQQWRLKVFPFGTSNVPQYNMQVFIESVNPTSAAHFPIAFHFNVALLHRLDYETNICMKDTDLVYYFGQEDLGFATHDYFVDYRELDSGQFVRDRKIRFRTTLERTDVDRSKRRRTGDALLPPTEPLMTLAALNPRADTGLVGLKNQGATCYMNSLLQGLFHLPCLRKAVYRIPVALVDARVRSIPYQLQTLFVRMQLDAEAPDTKALTTSFGWTDEEAFEQHDVQEFARVLLDKVDEVMQGHPESEDVIKNLFEGQSQTYITCDGGFESIRDESFFDISLDIRGNASLLDSFRQYVAAEELKGSNQYRTPEGKLVDARKGSRFVRFPRVMQLQLKRFAYDPMLDRMNKVDDMFSFPADLDLTDVLHTVAPADAAMPSVDESQAGAGASAAAAAAPRTVNPLADYVLHSVMVHSGGVHGGHYYAFVRPNPIGEPEKWFRLDDDRVAICTKAREAIEDNFGGSARPLLGATDVFRSKSDAELLSALAMDRQHSAYMLTYVRRSDAAELLAPVAEFDIPIEVTAAIAEDARLRAEADERLRVERLSIDIEVLFDDALFDAYRLDKASDEFAQASSSSSNSASTSSSSSSNEPLEPASFVSGTTRKIWRGIRSAKFESIKIQKCKTVVDLRQLISDTFGIPVNEQGLFFIAESQTSIDFEAVAESDDVRPFCLDLEAAPLPPANIICLDRPNVQRPPETPWLVGTQKRIRFFVARLWSPSLRESYENRNRSVGVSLFLSVHFNVRLQQTEFLGSLLLPRASAVSGSHIFAQARELLQRRDRLLDSSKPRLFELVFQLPLDKKTFALHDDPNKIVNGGMGSFQGSFFISELLTVPEASALKDQLIDAGNMVTCTDNRNLRSNPKNDGSVLLSAPARSRLFRFFAGAGSYARSQSEMRMFLFERRGTAGADVAGKFFHALVHQDDRFADLIQAIAANEGVSADHVRIYEKTGPKTFSVLPLHTHTYKSECRVSCLVDNQKDAAVFEVLKVSSDLLGTNALCEVQWYDFSRMERLTVVSLCAQTATVGEAILKIKADLVLDRKIDDTQNALDFRALDLNIEGASGRVVCLDSSTPGGNVWKWQNGFSEPSRKVLLEAVPADEAGLGSDAVHVWCRFESAGPHDQRFSAKLGLSETIAQFRVRLASRLNIDMQRLSRFKLLHSSFSRTWSDPKLLVDDQCIGLQFCDKMLGQLLVIRDSAGISSLAGNGGGVKFK